MLKRQQQNPNGPSNAHSLPMTENDHATSIAQRTQFEIKREKVLNPICSVTGSLNTYKALPLSRRDYRCFIYTQATNAIENKSLTTQSITRAAIFKVVDNLVVETDDPRRGKRELAYWTKIRK